jgi:AhpD family alkylhydroperoxidase
MSLSPAPELLAATWALLREAELVGGAAVRTEKEAAAGAVAVANRCPFCAEAHALLVHGGGAHELAEAVRRGRTPADARRAAIVDWAAQSRTPGAAALATPPFPAEQTAQFLGTVLVSHFINRMVTSLLDEEALLPQALRRSGLVRRTVGRTTRGKVRREFVPGRSLELLGAPPAADPPAWAQAALPIGTAYAALRAATTAGGALLSAAARTAVLDGVAAWDGDHPSLATTAWLDAPLSTLHGDERAAARLALLAALAPYRLTDADAAAWTGNGPDLIRVLAFGAMTAVVRVEQWISAAVVHAGADADADADYGTAPGCGGGSPNG